MKERGLQDGYYRTFFASHHRWPQLHRWSLSSGSPDDDDSVCAGKLLHTTIRLNYYPSHYYYASSSSCIVLSNLLGRQKSSEQTAATRAMTLSTKKTISFPAHTPPPPPQSVSPSRRKRSKPHPLRPFPASRRIDRHGMSSQTNLFTSI